MGYLKRHGASAGPWARPERGRAREARRVLHDVRGDRGRHAVPDDDDLRGRSADRARRSDRARVAAAHLLGRLRPALPPGRAEARRDARHGDDREAGRLRPALEHDDGDAGGRSRVRDRRAQVVLFRADVRRVPDPRAGARRTVVLFPSAVHARRRGQRDPDPAAEGQARRSIERELRGRVRRRARVASRRGRARRADHPRDGNVLPPRLRARAPPGSSVSACRRRSIMRGIARRSAANWSTSR